MEDGIAFDKEDIEKNLTLFLYPDDSDENGRLLRIYQQYFMVSAGAQLILDECIAKGCNLHDLADYAVIQINDTHPTMVIPELIRLLVEKGLDMDEAIEVVSKDMRLYKPYPPCRGTGKMAGILFEEGRSTVNADH